MEQRQGDSFNDAGNGLLQQQYNRGYNASDNIFSHSGDPIDASWGVTASAFIPPQSSRTAYHNGDWSSQQHLAITAQHNDRQSPLATNGAYNGATYNGYASPYSYQQQPQQQYDPSLLQPTQAFKQTQQSAFMPQTADTRTVAPQSLQQTDLQAAPQTYVDGAAILKAVPPSTSYNGFQIIDMTQLVKATNTQKLAAFATITRSPLEYNISRAAIPTYVPRHSKNALKRLAGQNGELLAKINHRDAKKARIAARKLTGTSRPMKTAGDVAGTARFDSASDMSEDESDDSDSEVEDVPLLPKRPDSPKGAIEYDTIQALWRSKRVAIDAADVRKGLVDFWELVKTVRDRWKTDAAAVTLAKEKNLKGEISLLEHRVKDQRDMIEAAFKAALKHGNRTIVETLSENTPLLFLCYQFLLDRFKADDCNGSLSRAILEVMSTFNSITTEKLEKTHLEKVLPRFVTKGDARTQFWTKQILSRAKQTSEVALTNKQATEVKAIVKPAGSKADAPAVTVKKPLSSTTIATTTSAIKKRPLDNDDGKPAAKKSATSNGIALKPNEPAKVKAPTTSKLTTGLFAGLQSAAKKPGTSVKTATTAASAVKPNPVVSKPVAPVAKAAAAASKPASSAAPMFSFTQAMQDLARPKEEQPKPKVVEKDIPNETPAEKTKRLRREARGVLRVRWKTAEELEQVRIFEHDPDEETGHDSSQTRDVGDLKGEGRMFKQQHNKMDIDDEEDEIEVKLIDWYTPAEIDFVDVPEAEKDRNFHPYGGGVRQPDSTENEVRKKYEDSTLMVFYSHSDDIPATPREPEEETSGDKFDVTSFGAVMEQYSDRAAKLRAARQPAKPIDFNALRNVLGMTGVQPTAPVQAPPVTPDLSAILAQFAQNKPAAEPQAAPVIPNFAHFLPQPAAPAPIVNGAPNIAAIIAALNAGGTPQPQPPAPIAAPPSFMPPPSMIDPGFAAFLASRGLQPQSGAPAPAPPSMFENVDRKRMRDDTDDNEVRRENPNYKTKICKYWQEGKCTKGSNCTYRHE